ncbi:MAG: response regulator transcription factor [Ardenticatenaceae bacterium]|nr:response regulator transcription factor [Ardenticatenaceae bacterium]
MDTVIRVVVVDDHFVSRKGIISLLGINQNISVVGEGSAGNHIMELLAEHRPDVLLTDLQMPGNANDPKGILFEPITTLKKAIEKYNTTSVIVISQENDVQTIQSLAEVGVKGYMLKTDDFARTLGTAVEMIHTGLLYFSPEVKEIIYAAPKIRQKRELTDQQLNVLRAIMRSPEATREALAESLYISKSTLQKHITAIFEAMNVPNMEACIIKAMRMRLVDVKSIIG